MMRNLASLYGNMKAHESATQAYREAFTLFEQHRQRFFPCLSEQEQWKWMNNYRDLVADFFHYLRQFHTQDALMLAWAFDIQLKSRQLQLNMLRQIRLTQRTSAHDASQKKYEAWQDARTAAARWMATPTHKRTESWEAIEKKLRQTEIGYFQAFPDAFMPLDEAISLHDLQTQLAADEAVVEMLYLRPIAESGYYMALILQPTAQGGIRWLEVGEAEVLEGESWDQFQRWIKQPGGQNRDLFEEGMEGEAEMDAADFYRLYWQPLEEHLSDVRKIYFGPAGLYHHFNPAALLLPAGKGYVLDKWEIHRYSQISDILSPASTSSSSASHTALLLGDPDFGQGDSTAGASPMRATYGLEVHPGVVSPLPGTRKEVLGIAERLRQASWETAVYLGAESQEAVLKQAHQPTVLHLATHGFFIPEKQGSKVETWGLTDLQPQENPYWRAGLLLAGSGSSMQAREEGIFYAYEAASLSLEETELVVLSACETGLSATEGYQSQVGLQRAFLLAGADTLLLSLWKVSDQATQELMITFYEHYVAGETPHQALKAAQQILRTRYPHPFYWGAFVLVGKSR